MQVVEKNRKNQWTKISMLCFVLSLAAITSLSAQLSVENSSLFPVEVSDSKLLPSSYVPSFNSNTNKQSSFPTTSSILPVTSPKVYSYHNLGIFCKLDVQLEKNIKLPVKFRLGTQQYVDQLEGKY